MSAPFGPDRLLDPEPFRDWCEKRLAPQPENWKHEIGELAGRVTVAELAQELGIDERRLAAWRRENKTLDRDYVEDALHRAGYALQDVYPGHRDDTPEVTGVDIEERRRPANSKLCDDQIRNLHLLHTRGGFSIRELGRRVWRGAGFASAASAEAGIRCGFRRLHLQSEYRHPTTIATLARCGEPGCASFPRKGSDRCLMHHPDTREEAALRAATLMTALRHGAAA